MPVRADQRLVLRQRVELAGDGPLRRVGALVEEPAFWKYLSGRKNLEYFAPYLRTAEKAGVGLAMENLADAFSQGQRQRTYTATPAELVALVDAFDHPLVGVLWDTGHAHLQGLEQEAALRGIGSRLKATHIADNNGLWDLHLLPFLGTVDWKAVMGGLRAIDYPGDFTYEIHNYVRFMPDSLRDAAARVAWETGEYLLGMK